MKVMVVSGSFATHTTKLYNYYVCQADRDFTDVEYLAVNYLSELQYLGRVIKRPIFCNYENDAITSEGRLSGIIQTDLREFKCRLKKGKFQLIILEPIIGGCCPTKMRYKGKGAFVSNIDKYKTFKNLAEFIKAHQII